MNKSDYASLENALQRVQEYMSDKYNEIFAKNQGKEKKDFLLGHILHYITNQKISVGNLTQEELANYIYNEMTEFSFLSNYINREDVEEIDINSWDSVYVYFEDGTVREVEEHFLSPEHAINVFRRLLEPSKMIVDASTPIAIGHLNKNIRITVTGRGIIDDDIGIAASIRIVNTKKLEKNDFIKNGTATEEMIDLLTDIYNYGCSTVIAGATMSGKTTLMSYILGETKAEKRLITIENKTREFDLRKDKENKNKNVLHLVTKECEDVNKSITAIKLLQTALTLNPDYLIVAEMKGEESMEAINAANTGHTVLTTIHSEDLSQVHTRIVALCSQYSNLREDMLYKMALEAFPVAVYMKRMFDGVRRITEISEFIKSDQGNIKSILYKFDFDIVLDENGKEKIKGQYIKVNDLSDKLKNKMKQNGWFKKGE